MSLDTSVKLKAAKWICTNNTWLRMQGEKVHARVYPVENDRSGTPYRVDVTGIRLVATTAERGRAVADAVLAASAEALVNPDLVETDMSNLSHELNFAQRVIKEIRSAAEIDQFKAPEQIPQLIRAMIAEHKFLRAQCETAQRLV